MKLSHYLLAMVFAGCMGTVIAAPAPEFADALTTIRAVGPEGQGNAAASTSWRKLAAGDGSSLLSILEAMDSANDYAMNWLRSAVDAISGRELRAGRRLPVADLQRFLLQTRHHPRARRLAFELIEQVDV